MTENRKLTDAELSKLRRNRPGVRASLACEGMYLTAEEEVERAGLGLRIDRRTLEAECIERTVEVHNGPKPRLQANGPSDNPFDSVRRDQRLMKKRSRTNAHETDWTEAGWSPAMVRTRMGKALVSRIVVQPLRQASKVIFDRSRP